MTKFIAFLLALFITSQASAQTSTAVVSQTCNVQLNLCTLATADGEAITLQGQWVYSGNVAATWVATDGSQTVKQCVAQRTPVSQSLYRIVADLVVACGDGSSVSGLYTSTRPGSGRGGWAWHPHVVFETVTVYP